MKRVCRNSKGETIPCPDKSRIRAATPRVCRNSKGETIPCPESWIRAATPRPKMRGLGDVVAAATAAMGISPCGGCKQRQEWLNNAIPFDVSSSDQENES